MTEDLNTRFETLTDIVRNAIDKVYGGEGVDLGQLEQKVQKLCADVMNANNQTKVAMQRPMAELIARLDELAHGLEQHKQRLKDQ
jgi:hypothetical protein